MPYTLDLFWTCSCCGKQYDKLSLAYALDAPDAWLALPADERSDRDILWTDSCVIDQQQYFIRGRIVIPIVGHDEPFIWGCWASVSRESFERFGKLWDAPAREQEPPLPAQLANDNPIYPATLGLACSVVMKNARRRPSFEIQSADHPLAIEQRNGITLDRVKEIASKVLRHSREG